jgi:hypothetical protein
MDNVAVIVLVVGGIAYVAYVIPVVFQFLAYCERVATASGRTKANASLISQDDGGLNAFQREQLRMLRSGDFMNCGDSVLINLGVVIARKLRMSFWGGAWYWFSPWPPQTYVQNEPNLSFQRTACGAR